MKPRCAAVEGGFARGGGSGQGHRTVPGLEAVGVESEGSENAGLGAEAVVRIGPVEDFVQIAASVAVTISAAGAWAFFWSGRRLRHLCFAPQRARPDPAESSGWSFVKHRRRCHRHHSIADGCSLNPVVDGPVVEPQFDRVEAPGFRQCLVPDGAGFQVERLGDQRWQQFGREDGHGGKHHGQFGV